MNNNKFKTLDSPFVRNVIIMTSGTAAAQVVSLGLSPIITRIYGPESYGLMGAFMSILSMITPIAALTYPIAIVLPKKDAEAKIIMRLSMYITTIVAIIVGVILLFFNQFIVDAFQIQRVAALLILVPMVIFMAGYLQVKENWLIRTKQFSITARVAFFHSLIINGSKVGIGIFFPFASVLIVLAIFGNFLQVLMLSFFTKNKTSHENSSKNVKRDDHESIKTLIKKYSDFPIYRSPQVFIYTATQSLPVLILTSFFGPASAGFYTIGKTVLQLPSRFIGKSVGDVFYPRISEAANSKENITKLIKKATVVLGLISFIPFGIVFFLGPWLFSFVFGPNWIVAGEYARWMTLGIFFGFIKNPSIKALPILSAQSFHLKYSIFMLITQIGALSIGFYLFGNDIVSVALFGVTGAILDMSLILITIIKSEAYDKINA